MEDSVAKPPSKHLFRIPPSGFVVIKSGDIIKDSADKWIIVAKFLGPTAVFGREFSFLSAALSSPNTAARVMNTNLESPRLQRRRSSPSRCKRTCMAKCHPLRSMILPAVDRAVRHRSRRDHGAAQSANFGHPLGECSGINFAAFFGTRNLSELAQE